jgi:hypothetical protein
MPPKKLTANMNETAPLTPEQEAALKAAQANALADSRIERAEEISATEPMDNARLTHIVNLLSQRVDAMADALGQLIKQQVGIGQQNDVPAADGDDITSRLSHIEAVLTKYYRHDFVQNIPHEDVHDEET